MHDETNIEVPTSLRRRSFIKRSALVGGATVWAAPTIQSLASPAFAAGSPKGKCTACLTGGGKILGGTYQDGTLDYITVGIGQLCCDDEPRPGNSIPQIQVTAHPSQNKGKKTDLVFHFDTLVSLTCKKEGNPAPPPETADCANTFIGRATDDSGHILDFIFQDNGEPSYMVDYVKLQVSGGAVSIMGENKLTHGGGGNLQVHDHLGPIKRDCSGC